MTLPLVDMEPPSLSVKERLQFAQTIATAHDVFCAKANVIVTETFGLPIRLTTLSSASLVIHIPPPIFFP